MFWYFFFMHHKKERAIHYIFLAFNTLKQERMPLLSLIQNGRKLK